MELRGSLRVFQGGWEWEKHNLAINSHYSLIIPHPPGTIRGFPTPILPSSPPHPSQSARILGLVIHKHHYCKETHFEAQLVCTTMICSSSAPLQEGLQDYSLCHWRLESRLVPEQVHSAHPPSLSLGDLKVKNLTTSQYLLRPPCRNLLRQRRRRSCALGTGQQNTTIGASNDRLEAFVHLIHVTV